MEKIDGVIVIVLAIILLLAVVCNVEKVPFNDLNNSTELALSSEGSFPLSVIIEDIESSNYYDGMDNETLRWMKSLGNKSVFSGDGMFVIMDFDDAEKIPSQFVTDVYITEFIECDVLENRSLGDIKYPRDILLVKNVRYLGENVTDLPGGGA